MAIALTHYVCLHVMNVIQLYRISGFIAEGDYRWRLH